MKTIFETIIKDSDRVIAIAGAGGKTSLMFLLAQGFQKDGEKVITTTTTRILMPTIRQSKNIVLFHEKKFSAHLVTALDHDGHATIANRPLPGNKLEGLSPGRLEIILYRSPAKRMIIEADGARGLSLKAPGEHEPVVPEWTDVFICMAGIDIIGKPLLDTTVFRAKRFATLTKTAIGTTITPKAVARLAVHPQGMLKGCPQRARSYIFFNKTDISESPDIPQRIIEAAKILEGKKPDLWIYGSIEQNRCSRYKG